MTEPDPNRFIFIPEEAKPNETEVEKTRRENRNYAKKSRMRKAALREGAAINETIALDYYSATFAAAVQQQHGGGSAILAATLANIGVTTGSQLHGVAIAAPLLNAVTANNHVGHSGVAAAAPLQGAATAHDNHNNQGAAAQQGTSAEAAQPEAASLGETEDSSALAELRAKNKQLKLELKYALASRNSMAAEYGVDEMEEEVVEEEETNEDLMTEQALRSANTRLRAQRKAALASRRAMAEAYAAREMKKRENKKNNAAGTMVGRETTVACNEDHKGFLPPDDISATLLSVQQEESARDQQNIVTANTRNGSSSQVETTPNVSNAATPTMETTNGEREQPSTPDMNNTNANNNGAPHPGAITTTENPQVTATTTIMERQVQDEQQQVVATTTAAPPTAPRDDTEMGSSPPRNQLTNADRPNENRDDLASTEEDEKLAKEDTPPVVQEEEDFEPADTGDWDIASHDGSTRGGVAVQEGVQEGVTQPQDPQPPIQIDPLDNQEGEAHAQQQVDEKIWLDIGDGVSNNARDIGNSTADARQRQREQRAAATAAAAAANNNNNVNNNGTPIAAAVAQNHLERLTTSRESQATGADATTTRITTAINGNNGASAAAASVNHGELTRGRNAVLTGRNTDIANGAASPRGSSPAKRKRAPVNKAWVTKGKAQPEPTKKPCSREVASLECLLSLPTNERRTSAKKLAPATKKSATSKAAKKSASAAIEQISSAPVKPSTKAAAPSRVTRSRKKETLVPAVAENTPPTLANAPVQRGIGGATELEEFDSTELQRKHKYRDDGRAYMWYDADEDAGNMKVISYAAKMEGTDLPPCPERPKADGKVTGKAAQAFNVQYKEEDNYVGYIAGNLLLPPKGIKDSESVGQCSQIFTVCKCQPKALEVAFRDPDSSEEVKVEPASAQRFLLSPGDMFQLPPGNSYRLENHSSSTESFITWTIIRPKLSRMTC